MARQIGLRNIHIAILTKDDHTGATYDTQSKLERAISAKLTPKMSSENIYSDDTVEDVITAFEGVDVEIEANQLSLESRAKLQGSKVVKGVLIESKEDIPPTLALGFKSKKNNGKYRYVWLLKGKFELASDEYDTEAERPQPKSAKLKGTFFERDYDGNYRFIADEDQTGVDQTIITSWFTAVPDEPVEGV
ncbi:major tail protein [Paramaledivibacter caminithermalis]|jgi:phi13 family phage major tail protein|uniref:Phage major tail protein, phi13 family n=1 Tax=Paramaledivibacter caminithermalis (strain DSM 15212 / CIP 107654 / DViRD3) TaxID=1121301 RepID=A0A1M6TBQ4_PARC5|nr:major tail protein [Paramaledivibacter caminithermalis]SHK54427.1 phage major tail protein, phi13 family [Paramaledivibacter caminithermalis DSM 15212]